MNNLFILYVAAFFLPLLFSSWRVAVVGLGAQGLLLALILVVGHEQWSWETAIEFASLLLLRAVFIPWYLARQMRYFEPDRNFSLISPHLTQWSIAIALMVIGFLFGNKMSPHNPQEAIQVGTAAGSILIGLLILANQEQPLEQIVGLFTFEGGITLVELLSPHAMPFPVRVGVLFVTVLLTVVCGQYLKQMHSLPMGAEYISGEEPKCLP